MPDRAVEYAPGLAGLAKVLPHGMGLSRGLRVPRTLMALAGRLGDTGTAEVVRVGEGCQARVHRPDALPERAPVLLWIHGGGRVMGAASQDDRFLDELAREVGCAAVAVEHRLAPEHPHPIPLEDCHDALAWLVRQPWVDPHRVAVGGASAGGGFAASLAQLALDRGTAAPVLQVLVYPMLDDRTGPARDRPGVRLWSGRDNELAWSWYLADEDRDATETVSPARRRDLSGLAPAWIGVGTLDLFLEESRDYARALQDAGVAAVLHEAVGAYHGFDQLRPAAPVARRFRDELLVALKHAFNERATEGPRTD